jgi:hypothetical protein
LEELARASNQGVRIIFRNGMTIVGIAEIKEYELGADIFPKGKGKKFLQKSGPKICMEESAL